MKYKAQYSRTTHYLISEQLPTPASQQTYSSALRRFFRFISSEENDLDQLAKTPLHQSPETHQHDITAFSTAINHLAPIGWNLYKTTLRTSYTQTMLLH